MREYFEQVYENKLDDLDKTNKCLERHTLLKMTQGKIETWIHI